MADHKASCGLRQPNLVFTLNVPLLLCFVVACWASATAAPYVLGPEDVVDVKVFQYDKLNATVTVGDDGTFLYPMLGRVKAAGLTTSELETELRKRLADGILKKPEVVVSIAQYASKKVIVIGAAQQTGLIPIRRSISLLELIARAGPTQDASGDIVIIRKDKDGNQQKRRISWTNILAGDVPESLELTDGDVVIVAKGSGSGLGKAFVFGEVAQAGMVPVGPGLSLREVILRCGGVTPNRSGEIVIVRREKDKESGESEPDRPTAGNGEGSARVAVPVPEPIDRSRSYRLSHFAPDGRRVEASPGTESGSTSDDTVDDGTPGVRKIAVTRSEVFQLQEIMLGRQRAIVRPGDTVFVKSIAEGKFYIIGFVLSTGPFPLKRGMTVLEAVAAAGGYDRLADPKRQVVFRKIGGQLMEVEAKDNTQLMPNDILKVPEAWF